MESRETYPCQIKILLDNAKKHDLKLEEKDGRKFIDLNGKPYEFLLDEYIPSQHSLVCFSRQIVDREIMLLDPLNPELETFYREVLHSFHSSRDLNFFKILNHALIMIRNKLNNIDEKQLNASQTEAKKTAAQFKGLPIINIVQNLKDRVGMCRHHALLGLYILGRLLKDGYIPPGKLYFHRDNAHNIPHGWVIYITSENNSYRFFNFDSILHKAVYEIICPFTNHLERYYGKQSALYFERKFFNFMHFSYQSNSNKPTLRRQPSTGSINQANDTTLVYEKKEELGKGSYGTVSLFVKEDKASTVNQKIAIKSFYVDPKFLEYPITKSDEDIRKAIDQCAQAIFAQCRYEAHFARIFSPSVYYAFNYQITIIIEGMKKRVIEYPKSYLALPFFNGKPLDRISKYSQEQAITISMALCHKIKPLHASTVIHGDITQGNVLVSVNKQLLTGDDVHLIDHSISARQGAEMRVDSLDLTTKPPEYKSKSTIIYDYPIDYYCAGYTLRETFKNVSFDRDIKAGFDEVVKGLTENEPQKRLTLDQALLKLQPLRLKFKVQFIKKIENDHKRMPPQEMAENLQILHRLILEENPKFCRSVENHFKPPFTDFFFNLDWNGLIVNPELLTPLILMMFPFFYYMEISAFFSIINSIPESALNDEKNA